jgi:predicted Zn-dependent protease
MPKAPLLLLCALALAPLNARAAAKEKLDDDPLLRAMVDELDRSKANLQSVKGSEPLYYLSYRVSDGRWFTDTASFGALEDYAGSDEATAGRARRLFVSARVGNRQLDNTHKVRGGFGFDHFFEHASLPIEDDPVALQVVLWRETDRAYKWAAKQLIKVKANKQVKVEEEDRADDFSVEKPQVFLGKKANDTFDRKAWKDRLKRASALFKSHPLILQSQVNLQGGSWTHYFVDSEGTRVREPRFFARIMIAGGVKTDDGMDLDLYDEFDADQPDLLPSEAQIEAKVKQLIARLEALRLAPAVEPYSGPAIITNRAAAVFFHEVFGHRVEGHRQKDEEEGRTFTKKVNQKIMPEFISIFDDPTLTDFQKTPLNGHYLYDDEGVLSQKASLVESGVLKTFLLGRAPIANFSHSNGHGRAQPGLEPVARQGNLVVQSARQMPFAELRLKLIEEIRRQKKPYGLVFEEISGGFTFTRTELPQAFKVLPLVVTRVFADGRPDELVRGVDIVGTPLQSLENILATGDDYAVFNGFCGAESGFVPVSAVAPSLLISEIEVERRTKGHDRPPLLPPPKPALSTIAPAAKEVK